MFYVYVLRLVDGTYYVGFSEDLKSRIVVHHQGGVLHTRGKRPVTLVFYSAFEKKGKALAFEKYLKSSSGFAFRNKRLV